MTAVRECDVHYMEFNCNYSLVFRLCIFLGVYRRNKPIQDSIRYYSLALFDKTHWETSDKVLFSQHGKALDAHPYAFTMYVEERQTVPKHLNHSEQIDEPTKSGVTAGAERIVTEYGQKNRHEVEEKDLKEFLRLQQMASEEDEDTDDSEQCEEHPSGLQRVFNALVSPVRSFLGK